jgi:single-strand DNA-binding protein
MANEPIITIVGNLTADPEIRFIQSGVAVVGLTIASTPRRFDKDKNEWIDGTTVFLRASAWRDHAEMIGANLHKGQRVVATGRLIQEDYTTKEGEKRSVLKLDIEEIGPAIPRFKPNADRAGGGGAQPQATGTSTQTPAYNPDEPF